MSVYLPKDRVTNQHQGYGFVEFRSEEVRGVELCGSFFKGGLSL